VRNVVERSEREHSLKIVLKQIALFEVTSDLRSGLRGRRRTYITILKRAWSANFKMVWYVLLQPLRPELDFSNFSCHFT
jgi:hypothetical protein